MAQKLSLKKIVFSIVQDLNYPYYRLVKVTNVLPALLGSLSFQFA